eukprot:1150935-Pelagomonas_calceolata.AAC.22
MSDTRPGSTGTPMLAFALPLPGLPLLLLLALPWPWAVLRALLVAMWFAGLLRRLRAPPGIAEAAAAPEMLMAWGPPGVRLRDQSA